MGENMERSISTTIYSVNTTSQDPSPLPAYMLKTALELGFKEDWLQSAIALEPELVIAPCREAGRTDEKWAYWAREFQTSAGRIDILLVSESGQVAIVETKLSYNPERRRSVLAQLLDYATSLPEMDLSKLPALPKTKSGQPLARREEVEQHIRDGDFLLILAADQIDPKALRLSRALLGEHLTMSWELVQVEMSIYERKIAEGPLHLMVPHLRGILVPEERQVVRVVIDEGQKPRVIVERVKSEGGGYARQRWSEEQFVEGLGHATLERTFKEFGSELLKLAKEFRTVHLSWGTGKTGSVTLKHNESGLIEYYLDGALRFRKDNFGPSVGEELGKEYLQVLKRMFPREMEMSYPTVWPGKEAKASLDELLSVLGSILERADRQQNVA